MLAGLLLSTTMACSDADPIQPNVANVSVVATTAPAYTAEYQWARFQIDQVTVRPLDPLTNSYLDIPLGLFQSPEPVDARATSPVTLSTTPLRAGSYQVEGVRISALSLHVDPTPPQAAVGCGAQGELESVRVAEAYLLSFASAPVLQVASDGTATLNISVDGPGLVTMLTNQPFTCGAQSFPPPTSSQLAQFISVD
jgi:hypothetical protein